MLGGCPAVIGNLWDVTDKDIDRFTLEMLRMVVEGESVELAMARARQACKLKWLIGAAPVMYGVPIRVVA